MPSIERVRLMPPVLIALLGCAWPFIKSLGDVQRDIDAIELHCGMRAITTNIGKLGMMCIGLDKKQGDDQDIATDVGLQTHLSMLMRVRARGLCWSAQECKTLIWTGRAQTGRDKEHPGGDIRNPKVKNANRQVACLVIVLVLAWLRDVSTCSENPSSTLLHLLKPYADWLQFVCGGARATRTYMGAFAGETPKPLHLWGNWCMTRRMQRTSPAECSKRLVDKGKRWTNGKQADLAASAAYTDEFGHEVARLLAEDLNPASPHTGLLAHFSKKQQNPSWDEIVGVVDALIASLTKTEFYNMDLDNIIQHIQGPQTTKITNKRFQPKDSTPTRRCSRKTTCLDVSDEEAELGNVA